MPEIDLALFQPDIPQNTGTLLRLGACLGITVHLIEPAGFVLSDKSLKRAGMDYLETAALVRHPSWEAFRGWKAEKARRLVLLSTRGEADYCDLEYRPGDVLMVGRESSGVPDEVFKSAEHTVRIPMHRATRSLNVAVAAAMVTGEALRQTGGWL